MMTTSNGVSLGRRWDRFSVYPKLPDNLKQCLYSSGGRAVVSLHFVSVSAVFNQGDHKPHKANTTKAPYPDNSPQWFLLTVKLTGVILVKYIPGYANEDIFKDDYIVRTLSNQWFNLSMNSRFTIGRL